MKLWALVQKDLQVLLKQLRVFLVFILLFSVMPGVQLNIFAVIYSAMLPYTAISADHQSRWDDLAAMMPYSVRDLVLSKYLLGWLFISGASLLSACARMIAAPLIQAQWAAADVVVWFSAGLLLMALTLPLIFRFGAERGRMVFLLVVCAGAAFIGLISSADPRTILPAPGAAEVLLPLLAAALSLVSVPVSMGMYRRRRWA